MVNYVKRLLVKTMNSSHLMVIVLTKANVGMESIDTSSKLIMVNRSVNVMKVMLREISREMMSKLLIIE